MCLRCAGDQSSDPYGLEAVHRGVPHFLIIVCNAAGLPLTGAYRAAAHHPSTFASRTPQSTIGGQRSNVIDRQRCAEQETLNKITFSVERDSKLGLPLDALNHDTQAQSMRHSGNGLDKLGVCSLFVNLADKTPIDLQRVDREPSQQANVTVRV